MEVIPGVYQIKMFASNLYLIIEGEELTLIDGGTKKAYRAVLALFRQLGFPLANLRRVLLTHADIDHVGAVNRLMELICPEVCASQIAAEALAASRSSRPLQIWGLRRLSAHLEPRLSPTMHVKVNRILEPGEVLTILGGLEVLAAPGHTPGQLVFFAREQGLLFSGDSFRTKADKIMFNSIKAFTWDANQLVETHHRLAALQPEIVCGGHGPVVYGAADKFVD